MPAPMVAIIQGHLFIQQIHTECLKGARNLRGVGIQQRTRQAGPQLHRARISSTTNLPTFPFHCLPGHRPLGSASDFCLHMNPWT